MLGYRLTMFKHLGISSKPLKKLFLGMTSHYIIHFERFNVLFHWIFIMYIFYIIQICNVNLFIVGHNILLDYFIPVHFYFF